VTKLEQILQWLNSSDLTDEQKASIQNHFQKIQESDELKDFQIRRLRDNLKITTQFLNKTVEDQEKTVALLKESNKQLDNFVKIASHDLKSPLRSISSFSALLKRKLENRLNEKETEYFQIIESGAKSMALLIDDLLLYTRINSEELNIQEEKLVTLIKEVLANLNHDIVTNKVKIESHFTPITLHCDYIKLKQVIQNLLSNSIKFSSFEGNEPHIVISLKELETHWSFTIKDNGIGIAEEFREVAFQEFKKLNGNSYEGSGMGLSIVKKIVQKHHGDVWIEPSLDKGTSITFTIAKGLNYP
jgi:signal transduction histidine kinase